MQHCSNSIANAHWSYCSLALSPRECKNISVEEDRGGGVGGSLTKNGRGTGAVAKIWAEVGWTPGVGGPPPPPTPSTPHPHPPPPPPPTPTPHPPPPIPPPDLITKRSDVLIQDLEAARFGLNCSNHSKTWQAPRQQHCRHACQNFRAIWSLWYPISRLRDFTRFGWKTSVRLVNRGPGSVQALWPSFNFCGLTKVLVWISDYIRYEVCIKSGMYLLFHSQTSAV